MFRTMLLVAHALWRVLWLAARGKYFDCLYQYLVSVSTLLPCHQLSKVLWRRSKFHSSGTQSWDFWASWWEWMWPLGSPYLPVWQGKLKFNQNSLRMIRLPLFNCSRSSYLRFFSCYIPSIYSNWKERFVDSYESGLYIGENLVLVASFLK